MVNRINPGEWLGLMGGGQLGRMFTHAAQALGFRVCVLEPTVDSPAGQAADEQIVAAYDDPAALDRLATRCGAVTTEFENVPASALSRLAQRVRVAPAPEAVGVAQDRVLEKRFIASQHIPVAPHAVIMRSDDFRSVDPKLFPGILKTARLGYDGKGQEKVASADAAREAWSRMNGVTCVLEKALPLRKEVSCIVARGADGDSATFPLSENEHRKGILAVSIAPARIGPELERQARQHATRIADALAYVGVLCVEFFVLDEGDNGRLVVNEIAPRPHNSGHYTIDACVTNQFEQQARILAGLPLGSTAQMAASVMLNVLGDVWFEDGKLRTPDWAGVLRVPGAKLHLYGKAEPRLGRKMGHVTAVNGTIDAALGRANEVARVLGIAPAD
jgi:5-(carboxyamino)imidazole ribonucleotide synthase